MEGRAITRVWGRWKSFHRRDEVEAESKNVLKEKKKKSRIKKFWLEGTSVENWRMAIITD